MAVKESNVIVGTQSAQTGPAEEEKSIRDVLLVVGARLLDVIGFVRDTAKQLARGKFREVYLRFWWLCAIRRRRRLGEKLIAAHGTRVQTGPFKGMQYVKSAIGSELCPKLLGSYEAELHEAVNKILRKQYERIINIGCAEGYYAIGLAMRQPRAFVVAFDFNPMARQLCEEMAALNHVSDRLLLGSECSHDDLRRAIGSKTLIFCDCESYEYELLRPDVVPQLAQVDMLVELHDFIDDRISPAIISRFSATHDITLIDSTDRNGSDYASLQNFSARDRRLAVNEYRAYSQQWALMLHRNH
ncbi:MAG TPA: hypothetical protein VFS90_23775 [Pyrinomonadaceae bacterium]|nr:hypothetical protein [Pyrinomonadaceae bacterium]